VKSALLVEPLELHQWIADDRCTVFDCRFDLKNTEAGRNAWLAGHIPGAVYAHLDDDLAGPVTTTSGRHPLPATDAFADFLARSGWRPGRIAVAYDGGGGMVAARLWWLMRYFSLDCGLLNGGLAAWTAAALPLETGAPEPAPAPPPVLAPNRGLVMRTGEVEAALAADQICLLDARAAGRFRGESEPLDSVAGHVPGARNFPCDQALEGNRLKSAGDLRRAYTGFAGKKADRPVVHMCGSGVTACLNLFAMEQAGFTNNRLYVGSWSEWIRDPDRPVAVGDE
jgi:thiosulfate/3-mercaptopyruvate sulfurtransferase